MSSFARINTRKERKAVRPDLTKVKQKRMMIRKESLLRIMKEKIKACTKGKVYFLGKGRKSEGLRAWIRYESHQNSSAPCKNIKGEDITLGILELPEGVKITINKVRFECDERSHLPYSQSAKLADLLMETPHNQKGEGQYRLTGYWSDFGYIEQLIKALSEDLEIMFLTQNRFPRGDQITIEGEYRLP